MKRVLVLIGVVAVSSTAVCDTLCFTVTRPSETTNWSGTVAIPRFDPRLGLLREVRLRLDGGVAGAIGIESMSPNAQTLTATLQVTTRLYSPDLVTEWLVVQPSSLVPNINLGPFDGVVDFGGTSGATFNGLSGTAFATVVFPYPSTEAAFLVGPPGFSGTLITPLAAQGSSFFTGNTGNEASFFHSDASADIEVCYVFDLDCNGNGIADTQDLSSGTSLDSNGNGVPDECDYVIDPSLCLGDGSGIACPCGNTSAPGSGEGCLNSFGTGGLLAGSGVAQVMADTVVLTASGLPSSTTALFYQGTTTVGGTSGVSFGDGLRCAGGNIVRLGRSIAQAGVATFPPSGSPGIAALGGLVSGPVTRFYQCWYRNAAVFCTAATFNLTNGMRIDWGV